jgi:hypothetical protein
MSGSLRWPFSLACRHGFRRVVRQTLAHSANVRNHATPEVSGDEFQYGQFSGPEQAQPRNRHRHRKRGHRRQ